MTTNRHDFFKIIGTLPLAVMIPQYTTAKPQPPARQPRLVPKRFFIAGFQLYGSSALLRRPRASEKYRYTLEVDNRQTYRTTCKGVRAILPHRLKPGARLKLTAELQNRRASFISALTIRHDFAGQSLTWARSRGASKANSLTTPWHFVFNHKNSAIKQLKFHCMSGDRHEHFGLLCELDKLQGIKDQ